MGMYCIPIAIKECGVDEEGKLNIQPFVFAEENAGEKQIGCIDGGRRTNTCQRDGVLTEEMYLQHTMESSEFQYFHKSAFDFHG